MIPALGWAALVVAAVYVGSEMFKEPPRGGSVVVAVHRDYMIGTREMGEAAAQITKWSIWEPGTPKETIEAWHRTGTGTVPGLLVSGSVQGSSENAIAFAQEHIDFDLEAHGRVRGVNG